MSRNSTEHVYKEDQVEFLARALRQMLSAKNAVRFAQAGNQASEIAREEDLLAQNIQEVQKNVGGGGENDDVDNGKDDGELEDMEKGNDGVDGTKKGNARAKAKEKLKAAEKRGKKDGKATVRKIGEAVEEKMATEAKEKVSNGASRPTQIVQLLRSQHSRNALMCLVAFNKHFRQDQAIWTQGELSRHFLNVHGGVSDTISVH